MNLNHILQKKSPIFLRVKITPCSAKNEIKEIMDDETLKIRIKSPPERGKANKELIKFLSKELNISKDKITIISGKYDALKLLKVKHEKK